MRARATEIKTFIANVEKAVKLYILESDGLLPTSWNDLDMDLTGYCNNTPQPPNYGCNLKSGSAALFPSSSELLLYVSTSEESAFGPSVIQVTYNKNGTISKTCHLGGGSLKAKPLCDYLQQDDTNWNIELPSGM